MVMSETPDTMYVSGHSWITKSVFETDSYGKNSSKQIL